MNGVRASPCGVAPPRTHTHNALQLVPLQNAPLEALEKHGVIIRNHVNLKVGRERGEGEGM
jgi:hypothetical protein